jgi:hypothetical protein
MWDAETQGAPPSYFDSGKIAGINAPKQLHHFFSLLAGVRRIARHIAGP